jgi:hypothetical protein
MFIHMCTLLQAKPPYDVLIFDVHMPKVSSDALLLTVAGNAAVPVLRVAVTATLRLPERSQPMSDATLVVVKAVLHPVIT